MVLVPFSETKGTRRLVTAPCMIQNTLMANPNSGKIFRRSKGKHYFLTKPPVLTEKSGCSRDETFPTVMARERVEEV